MKAYETADQRVDRLVDRLLPGKEQREGCCGAEPGVQALHFRFACDMGQKARHFVCRAGICGTCTSRIISGEVAYFEDPLEDVSPGELLLCCSRPKTAIVFDL